MKISLAAAAIAACARLVTAASTFSPARPPAIPLAVRNPYMSTWLQAGSDGGNGGNLPGEWPTFWTSQVTGWTGMVNVDGLTYIWMGAPNGFSTPVALASQVSMTYTSTRSTFVINCGASVQLTVEFLSPVTPQDLVRSSLAATYLNVGVKSLDGQLHSVQIYTDISAEWTSGDRDDVAQWAYGIAPYPPKSKRDEGIIDEDIEERDVEPEAKTFKTYGTKTSFVATKPPATRTEATYSHYSPVSGTYATFAPNAKGTATPKPSKSKPTVTPGLFYHQVWRQLQQEFTEISDQAEWGYWYYSTDSQNNLTWQQSEDILARGAFAANGTLQDYSDPNFRAISDNWPVFAYAVDLGMVGKKTMNTLFTINFMQDNVILYENGYTNSNQSLAGLWTKYFDSQLAANTFFYQDYKTSGKMCNALDKQIKQDSIAAGGSSYYTLTALATRQAFNGLQLAANGTGDDYYVFMKEISSDGDIQTVDVIFPLHPILVYLNPTWIKGLLDPLIINQEAGFWPYAYSIHDLGYYPNATGHNNGNDEQQPLEECGNMIIMALTYAQRTGDNAWLSQHYAILRQWNEYLIEEALYPQYQISTDDFAGALANQTNLAIKGIIGIGAMAEIANRTGNVVDGVNYTQIALSYITQWQVLGVAQDANPPHSTLNYGSNDTYSLLYNLFFDRQLNLGLVPQSVYDMQSNWYPTVLSQYYYGVPLDTRHTYTKLDWQTLCASIAAPSTQGPWIQKLAYWINNTPTNYALTDLYDCVSGNYPGFDFIDRPVVGALFGLLALKSAPSTPALSNGS